MTARAKSRHVAGRVVYIGFRVYDPALRKMRSCRGLNIRAEKFSPDEVHRIVVDALLTAVPTARIIRRGKEQSDGNEEGQGQARG